MKINADLSERAVARTEDMEWVASPADGVWRKMLDRKGDEVARATSVVRYEPGSSFPTHTHGGGEEFLVLEGVFSDESGHFPAGTYVRNPIGSEHAPHTEQGCVILVKLRQMRDPDEEPLVVRTAQLDWAGTEEDGRLEKLLFRHEDGEVVRMERWEPGWAPGEVRYERGAEFFVLEGGFEDENAAYGEGDWVRLPPGATHRPRAQQEVILWSKRGHLAAELEEGE